MNKNQPPFAMNSASLETAKEKRKKRRLIEARRLTPNELQEKLDSLGAGITRESLEELCRAHPSARELCFTLVREPAPDEEKLDWLWACIAALWETWFPHIPSIEAIDETMQSGYACMMANDPTGACHEWICCWKSIQSLIKKFPIPSIEEFDTRFVCTQMLFNWVQDFEMELGNAALADRSLNRVRKEFCEEILALLDPLDENTRGNMTRAIAESLFNMGDRKAAFSLYKSRLEENPRWGWGWVGWADLYSFSEKTKEGCSKRRRSSCRRYQSPASRRRPSSGNDSGMSARRWRIIPLLPLQRRRNRRGARRGRWGGTNFVRAQAD
jgi:hypothetical protein